MGTTAGSGTKGVFVVRGCQEGRQLQVIASESPEERVSVGVLNRANKIYGLCGQERALITGIFWDAQDIVMHTDDVVYVDDRPYTLHIWRVQGRERPTPPTAAEEAKRSPGHW